MTYTKEHALKALEIVQSFLPYVTQRDEYVELIQVCNDERRWSEANEVFSRIRTNITLPFEKENPRELDHKFVYIAECAAKTIYNCSGSPAPFDEDSYDWLLRLAEDFKKVLERMSN